MRTAILLAFAVALVGCQRHQEPTDASQPASTAATTPGAQTPPPEATQPPTAGPGSEDNMSAANMPQPEAPQGFDIGVGQSAEHGRYLVDGTGKTVYMLDKDTATTSTCHDACATQWPPLLAQNGTPKGMDPSIDESAISVIQRKDGSQQVAYGGHPLYHYQQDTAAGQLNGAGKEDQFGHWSVLTPEGQPAKK